MHPTREKVYWNDHLERHDATAIVFIYMENRWHSYSLKAHGGPVVVRAGVPHAFYTDYYTQLTVVMSNQDTTTEWEAAFQ